MNPMDAVTETIRTYDRIAPAYCAKITDQKFLAWEEDYIKELLACIIVENPLILDVGCGPGHHCAIIEKHGARVVGIDLSDGMLGEAKALYPRGDFRKMDMRNLLCDDNSFDGIWASGSIYHVTKADAKHVVQEFARVLKTGGAVAVNFKLGTGEGLEDNPKSFGGSPRYFAYYSEQDIKNLFEEFGFEELKSCMFPEKIFDRDVQQMWFKLG